MVGLSALCSEVFPTVTLLWCEETCLIRGLWPAYRTCAYHWYVCALLSRPWVSGYLWWIWYQKASGQRSPLSPETPVDSRIFLGCGWNTGKAEEHNRVTQLGFLDESRIQNKEGPLDGRYNEIMRDVTQHCNQISGRIFHVSFVSCFDSHTNPQLKNKEHEHLLLRETETCNFITWRVFLCRAADERR